MTGYNAVNDTNIDDLSLGLCDICNVRLTVGCEHSQRIEYQEWLGVYLAAEEMAHPVDVAQRLEREIDAMLDGRNEIENAQITATFGKVKVTTSAEWRKRHLHQTAAEVEAARVQAEMLKGLLS